MKKCDKEGCNVEVEDDKRWCKECNPNSRLGETVQKREGNYEGMGKGRRWRESPGSRRGTNTFGSR